MADNYSHDRGGDALNTQVVNNIRGSSGNALDALAASDIHGISRGGALDALASNVFHGSRRGNALDASAANDNHNNRRDVLDVSLGSQGSGSSSAWLSLEGKDQVTRFQAVVDLEFDRARFDREWETRFGEDASSSASNSSASTMEVEDEEEEQERAGEEQEQGTTNLHGS